MQELKIAWTLLGKKKIIVGKLLRQYQEVLLLFLYPYKI